MSQFYTVLTVAGEQQLAKAVANGVPLQLTTIAVGDGAGKMTSPTAADTALKREVRRAAVNKVKVDDKNPNYIIAEQIIPETEGGFWIREIALYDKNNHLIAIANCPETYKPKLKEGSGKTHVIRMVLVVSNTAAIELKTNPSIAITTQDELIAHTKSTNHPHASINNIGFVQLSSEITSNSEILAATPKAIKQVNELNVKKSGDTMSGTLVVPRVEGTTIKLQDNRGFVDNIPSVQLQPDYETIPFDIWRKHRWGIVSGEDTALLGRTSNLTFASWYGIGFAPLHGGIKNNTVVINTRIGEVNALGGYLDNGQRVYSPRNRQPLIEQLLWSGAVNAAIAVNLPVTSNAILWVCLNARSKAFWYSVPLGNLNGDTVLIGQVNRGGENADRDYDFYLTATRSGNLVTFTPGGSRSHGSFIRRVAITY